MFVAFAARLAVLHVYFCLEHMCMLYFHLPPEITLHSISVNLELSRTIGDSLFSNSFWFHLVCFWNLCLYGEKFKKMMYGKVSI